MTFFEELYVDYKVESIEPPKGLRTAQRIRLAIHPKKDVVLQNIEIQFNRVFNKDERIFCNGYQSWSESREYELGEQLTTLRRIARPYMGHYGDYHFPNIQRGKGHLHSWTYGYIRNQKDFFFIGSLNDRNAFTLLQFDSHSGSIRIEKDVLDLALTHSFPVLDIVLLEGTEQAVFDTYFDWMELDLPTTKPAVGWTSWYNYYTAISEEIILKNLDAFAEKNRADADQVDTIFQIDDGYQNKIGDWLDIKASFPNGMAPIAKKIQAKGYLAGLWLAPFVCEQDSAVFRKHPEWLVRDKQGKLLKAGYNPLWSGHFYVLDFYHDNVQDYLTKVILTIVEKWGFDMVKLDFLYAACIIPRPYKTRGQVMSDAMSFLRNLVGKKRILACGVPLASTFGLVDYCRIGADIHLKWEHQLLKFLRHRERVSTIVALRTVLGRWQLNQRAFINDPDVFILREGNNQLSPVQQHSILIINTLLGSLIFCSDYLADYNPEQAAELQQIFDWQGSRVRAVERQNFDCYTISFSQKGNDYVAYCNLRPKASNFTLKKSTLQLEPFETIILKA